MPSGVFGARLQSARELWVANDVKSLAMPIHGQMYLGVGGFADYPLAPGGVWVTLQWRPRSSFTRSATPSPALPPTPVIAPATDAPLEVVPVTVVGDRSRQSATVCTIPKYRVDQATIVLFHTSQLCGLRWLALFQRSPVIVRDFLPEIGFAHSRTVVDGG